MSKEKMLIWIVVITILIFIFHTTFTRIYIKYGLDYDRQEIEKVCIHPAFYDCDSVIKIKEYCFNQKYYNRLNGCVNNVTG